MNGTHSRYPGDESDDARLTAYALDQLGAEETAAVEVLLARSPEAREAVREIRATGRLIRQALERTPQPEVSPAVRAAVEQRFDEPGDEVAVEERPGPAVGRRSRRRLAAFCTAAAGVALAIVALSWIPSVWNAQERAPEVALSVDTGGPETLDGAELSFGDGQQGLETGGLLVKDSDADSDGLSVAVSVEDATLLSVVRGPAEGTSVDGRRNLASAYGGSFRTGSVDGVDLGSTAGGVAVEMPPAAATGSVTNAGLGLRANGPAPVAGQAVGAQWGRQDGESPQQSYGFSLNGRGSGQRQSLLPTYGGSRGHAAEATPPASGSSYRDQHNPSRRGEQGGEAGQALGRLREQNAELSRQLERTQAAAREERRASSGAALSLETISPNRRYVRISPSPLFSGIAEVNLFNFGDSHGAEQYDPIVENPFVRALKRPESTFSIDVDTASYANVRRFLNSGSMPPPNAVRIEEMVNYFHYDYAPPEDEGPDGGPDGEPFSVHTETAECPWNTDNRLLRVALKGREVDPEQRGPSNLVFLLDVSGSMRDDNKLPLVKQAMLMLVDQLTEDDRLAIVTYAASTGVVLESTCGDRHRPIRNAIEALSAGGSTHGSAGIQLAYQQAAEHFVPGGANRVILCTDGDLNVGITDDDQLVELITTQAKTGVFLTVLGFGTGNLKDAKLEKLADHGNGMYAYVDSIREAQRILVEQVTGSLITIAKDVKIQVEFNPARVESYRLVGYENRLMAARDFDNDKKDAGEIGAGHTVTAFYEIVPAESAADDEPEGPIEPVATRRTLKYQHPSSTELTEAADSDELLTLRLRYKRPEADESVLREFVVEDSDARFGQASDDFRFAAAVASFGMMLRHSQHAAQLTYSAVEEFGAGAVGDDTDGFRTEFVELIRRAAELDRLKKGTGSEPLPVNPD